MANVDTEIDIDSMACERIESIPGTVCGRPIVLGTCILPDAIEDSYEMDDSVEELQEGFPALSMEQIKRVIEYGVDQWEQCCIEPLRTP